MEVSLITRTPNMEEVISIAARTCYSNKSYDDLVSISKDEEKRNKFIKNIIATGHESVLEHASFTFYISGVSRSLTHQLVRHRVASFSQQSQRYTSLDDSTIWNVTPNTIARNRDIKKKYDKFIEDIESFYDDMKDDNIPSEDARFILPNATKSNIVVTMNVRELLHFFGLRCCTRAQWEIRELANSMLKICKNESPLLFERAGANCEQQGYCPEGQRCCGKKPTLQDLLTNYKNQKENSEG